MSVRERLVELVQQSGLKQRAISDRMGEPEYWLSNRLIGRTAIKADDLPKIASALDVDACELLRPVSPSDTVRLVEPPSATYIDADVVTQKWARRMLNLEERDVQLLVDFLEYQRTRE